ncbi:hypothetical protein CHUAL_000757 [Chamberlinius hualienensis]
MADTVGIWEVSLNDGLHRIDFEHGTTTGKRVVKVDGQEVLRRDWMFRLVGSEFFTIGKAKCVIRIEPVGGFSYEYSLDINGKSYKKFVENQNKIMKCWCATLGDENYRVTLEKDSMDVWINGQNVETWGEFVEDGTETHFTLGDHQAYIKAISSGNKREGLIHSLIIDGFEVPESIE